MMKKNILRTIIYTTGIMATIVLLAAVLMIWFGGSVPKEGNTETESEEEDLAGLFLVVDHNTAEELLTVYSYETKTKDSYSYNYATRFCNKYGDDTTASRFSPGKVVRFDGRDKEGYLTAVRIAEDVWEQENVRRFSADESRGIFSIGSSNYSIQSDTMVFSNGHIINLGDLTKNDIVSVVGLGSQLLSVNVTTGHGHLALINTELFDGSMLKLNDNIYAEVTSDMEMELPEGQYTLTVANDGWGGTKDIEIVRGETKEVDLDEMKGEGKKKGQISFRVNVDEVRVYLDYEKIDHTKPVEVTYGTHILEVRAVGYTNWKKYLVVNSEEATIIVEMEEEDEKTSEEESESESKTSEKNEPEETSS